MKKSSLSSKKISKKKRKEKKHIINELSINHQLGYKICKLNSILDNMMEKCREKKNNYIALSKKFHDEGMEMIKNISEKDQFIGMILCIKFFKGIIEKYIKFKNKKINIEKYLDENKFNEKILKICEKIEKIEQSFNNGNNNNKNIGGMTPNLKTINLSNELMTSSDNKINRNKYNNKIYFECIHKWNIKGIFLKNVFFNNMSFIELVNLVLNIKIFEIYSKIIYLYNGYNLILTTYFYLIFLFIK